MTLDAVQIALISMRRFLLNRKEDVSGVSSVGLVAEGVQFSEGKCVLVWRTEHKSTAIYENVSDLIAIHGHNGKTVIEWIDD